MANLDSLIRFFDHFILAFEACGLLELVYTSWIGIHPTVLGYNMQPLSNSNNRIQDEMFSRILDLSRFKYPYMHVLPCVQSAASLPTADANFFKWRH